MGWSEIISGRKGNIIDNDYIAKNGYGLSGTKCFVDGVLSKGVVSANPDLKRISVYPSMFSGESERPEVDGSGKRLKQSYVYPKSLRIESGDGKIIASWGC